MAEWYTQPREGGLGLKGLFTLLILAAAVCVSPASASFPMQTRTTAERYVLEIVRAAAMKDPARAPVTEETRAVCVGLGPHVGSRYRRFQCTIWPFNGGTLTLIYHAKAGGHSKAGSRARGLKLP